MLCIGDPMQGRLKTIDIENIGEIFLLSSSSRNLVSASQDGKLIVWDSYTTNKVKSNEDLLDVSMNECISL